MQDAYQSELQRMHGVADMLITGNSVLRDTYGRKALILDLSLTLVSGWLTALAFASDELLAIINPTTLPSNHLIGIVAVIVFIISLMQIQIKWKEKSAAHQLAAKTFGKIKQQIGSLMRQPGHASDREFAVVEQQYSSAGEFSVEIPEVQFLRLKKIHKKKILVSKYLDEHPGANISWFKIRIWFRDNFSSLRSR